MVRKIHGNCSHFIIAEEKTFCKIIESGSSLNTIFNKICQFESAPDLTKIAAYPLRILIRAQLCYRPEVCGV